MHITLGFNGATVDRHVEQRAGGKLFDALGRFASFQAENLATAMTAILSGGSDASSWLAAVVDRVQDVATAWATPAQPKAELDAIDPTLLPAPFRWDFVLQVPDESQPGDVLLRWDRDGSAPASAWPTIEGVHGTPTQQPNEYAYTLGGSGDTSQPTLAWPGLQVIANQSISAYSWIVRNETLAGCGGKMQSRETNPGLIYSTATVSFGNPVVPLLEVADTLTITEASLGAALNDLFNQVLPSATPPTQIGVGIEVGYELNLVEGPSGQRLRTQLPVFLVQDEIGNAGSAQEGVHTPSQFVAALRAALTKWYADFTPAIESAALRFTLTVFAAGSRQPLARLQDVEAPVSGASWWTT
jgi:hypothetical protein